MFLGSKICVHSFSTCFPQRISNLLPKSRYHWDKHFTLLRQDVTVSPSGLSIALSWTKSRQSKSQFTILQVPALPSHPSHLCPVKAISQLFHKHSLPQDAYISQGHLVSLTQMQARLALKCLCQQLKLPYHQGLPCI